MGQTSRSLVCPDTGELVAIRTCVLPRFRGQGGLMIVYVPRSGASFRDCHVSNAFLDTSCPGKIEVE
jgi:hypothetical protein